MPKQNKNNKQTNKKPKEIFTLWTIKKHKSTLDFQKFTTY